MVFFFRLTKINAGFLDPMPEKEKMQQVMSYSL